MNTQTNGKYLDRVIIRGTFTGLDLSNLVGRAERLIEKGAKRHDVFKGLNLRGNELWKLWKKAMDGKSDLNYARRLVQVTLYMSNVLYQWPRFEVRAHLFKF